MIRKPLHFVALSRMVSRATIPYRRGAHQSHQPEDLWMDTYRMLPRRPTLSKRSFHNTYDNFKSSSLHCLRHPFPSVKLSLLTKQSALQSHSNCSRATSSQAQPLRGGQECSSSRKTCVPASISGYERTCGCYEGRAVLAGLAKQICDDRFCCQSPDSRTICSVGSSGRGLELNVSFGLRCWQSV